MIWLIIIPLLLNFGFKYMVTMAVPVLRFCFIYLFYIPVFSIIFLSSIYFIFLTNWASKSGFRWEVRVKRVGLRFQTLRKRKGWLEEMSASRLPDQIIFYVSLQRLTLFSSHLTMSASSSSWCMLRDPNPDIYFTTGSSVTAIWSPIVKSNLWRK